MKLSIKKSYLDLRTITFSVIFLIWTFNFLWPSIGMRLISRFGDIGWLLIITICFFASGKFRIILVKVFPFYAFFWILLLLSFLNDGEHPYKVELYFKTAFYVPLAFTAGIVFASHFFLKKQQSFDYFIFFLGWATVLLVFMYSLYAVMLGWRIGQSLLGVDIGSYYQGISRIMAVSAMIVVVARSKLPEPIVLVTLALCLIIIIGFSGMGGMIGVLFAIVWFLRTTFFNIEIKNSILKKTFAFFAILFLVFITINIGEGDANVRFARRLLEKFSQDGIDGSQGRGWLMLQGVALWMSGSLGDFMSGPGLINYSNSIGYFQDYRHPHNLFINGVVWFGAFFIPCMLLLAVILLKALKFIFINNTFINFVSLMFLNYFMLAMIGGDFEQNRHLFFMMGSVFYCSLLMKRTSSNKSDRMEVAGLNKGVSHEL